MLEQYRGKGSGIPYFLIFDKTGKLLSDSKMSVTKPGSETIRSNIGCPATDQEVSAFVEILKRTSTINGPDAAVIIARFKQNRN
jgi:hypothetical protein